MSILFSCVGNTDPFRGYYDGPMIHILRNYREIDKCFIFLTKSMSRIHREKNYYQRAIEHVAKIQFRKIDLIAIETGIENANDFNVFYDKFVEIFTNIRKEYADEKIICNISSGTPQMTSSLIILICQDLFSNLAAIQVKGLTDKDKTYAYGTDNPKYDYEDEEKNCLDDEIDSTNRCEDNKPIIYARNKLINTVKALLNTYQYSSVYIILKEYKVLNTDAGYYLQFLLYRQQFKFNKSIEFLNKLKLQPTNFFSYDKNIIKNNNRLKIIESLIAINNHLTNCNYNELMIVMVSYIIVLEKELINKYSQKKLVDENCKIDLSVIKNSSPILYNTIASKFKEQNNIIKINLNVKIGNVIIKYFNDIEKKLSDKNIVFLNDMETLVKKRNEAAHRLCSISKNDISSHIDIYSIVPNLIELLKIIYPDLDTSMLKIYDEVNDIIIKKL